MTDTSSAWHPEQLDLESDQIRQVYANYGSAMYYAQVLEHGLVNFVAASRAGHPDKYSDALWDELFGMTMGRQLQFVFEEAELSDVVIEQLRKALRVRNFLAHDFFRQRAEKLLSFRGRNEMLHELELLREELRDAEAAVSPTTLRLLDRKGVSREMVEAEMARVYTQHGDGSRR
jgi:hypothetical protein